MHSVALGWRRDGVGGNILPESLKAPSWGAIVLPGLGGLPHLQKLAESAFRVDAQSPRLTFMLHFPNAGQKQCREECSYLIELVRMFVQCCV